MDGKLGLFWSWSGLMRVCIYRHQEVNLNLLELETIIFHDFLLEFKPHSAILMYSF